MTTFDFQSGVRGAEAGTTVMPGWGTLAGFVIGGFVGGHKKAAEMKKLKKKQRRYEQAYQKLLSPEYGAKLQAGFVPGFRNTVAQGLGPMLQSTVATNLSRHGLTGTGLGNALYGLGTVAPDIAANQFAANAAGPLWDKQIQAFNDKARSENIGWPGGPPVQKADPFGSAGALVDLVGSYGSMGGGFGSSSKGLLGGGGFSNPYIGKHPGPDTGLGGWQMPQYYTTDTNYGSTFANQFAGVGGNPNSFGAQYGGALMPFQYRQPTPYYGAF